MVGRNPHTVETAVRFCVGPPLTLNIYQHLILDMRSLEEYAEEMEIKKIITSMMMSALAFIVAFQWRDVIRETIDVFLPHGEGLIYKWFGAVAFTVIAAGFAILLIKIHKANIVPDHLEPHKRVAMELKKKREAKKKKKR